jgi:hypothetical protein
MRPAIEAAFCRGSAGDLGRVDDAGLDQVLVLVGAGVVAEVGILVIQDLAHDDHRAPLHQRCLRSLGFRSHSVVEE